MKRIAAMLFYIGTRCCPASAVRRMGKEPGAEKDRPGLTAEVKPATDFTAKANTAVYDELDFDDKQEYESPPLWTLSRKRRGWDRRAGNA